MVETYVERVHTEHAVLDIGQDIGALVIYTREELLGKEIEVSPKGNDTNRVHTRVLERRANGRAVFAALFLALPAGNYTTWSYPSSEVTVVGGEVAQIDWRDIGDVDVYISPCWPSAGHAHRHGYEVSPLPPPTLTDAPLPEITPDMLPPRYRNGKPVCATPMGSAPLRYTDDGQVAWDQMWTDFCDLALAGGPPHRDTVLEPVAPDEVQAAQDDYQRVVAEIERGFRLVTGLPTVRSEKPGWVGLKCENEPMARWLQHTIVVENVSVRREGTVLFLPAGPAFRLEKEIKNVITVVAKTHHYWTEHRNS